MSIKLFCIGGATVDYKFVPHNELTLATSNPVHVKKNFGGVARNIAETLSHWTKSVYLQTVIGNDAEGRDLLTHLRSLSIHTEFILQLQQAPTARYYAILDEGGDLHIACADMQINDLVTPDMLAPHWEICTPNDYVFLDTNLPATVVHAAIDYALKQQLKLCIDPVSNAKAQKLPQNLHGIYLLKPNRLETEIITGMKLQTIPACIAAGQALLHRGVQNVVITLAEQGYVIVTADLQTHIPNKHTTKIKDVNGAGDTFMAGMIYALQQNASLIEACEWGNAAAQLSLQSETNIAFDSMNQHAALQ